MTVLTTENYNHILKQGYPMLILVYNPGEAGSILAYDVAGRIDEMHGKSFEIYTVDYQTEREIIQALDVPEVPFFIFIKDKHVQRTLSGIPTENELLSITR